MLEAEYKRNFDIMATQIAAATSAFYTYMEIHKFASEGNDNYEKINRDAHFWSGQLYALQNTWFIVLGRIFDRSKDAYSIYDFLASTVAYKGFFSSHALANRKRKDAGRAESEWLDDYLKSVWEPTTADLEKIKSAIESSHKKWEKSYKPIRDKVFAHTDINVVAPPGPIRLAHFPICTHQGMAPACRVSAFKIIAKLEGYFLQLPFRFGAAEELGISEETANSLLSEAFKAHRINRTSSAIIDGGTDGVEVLQGGIPTRLCSHYGVDMSEAMTDEEAAAFLQKWAAFLKNRFNPAFPG